MSFMVLTIRYTAYLVLSVFGLHCLVAGLYYLAEFVEEHTKTTKQIMAYALYVAVGLHVLLLLFEDLPTLYLLFSLGCHFVYRPLLETYPYIDIFSPLFISSGVLAFCDHFLWFYYFAHYYAEPEDVIAFFVCCVWLVPFTLFVSLSAGEDILPFTRGGGDESVSMGEDGKERREEGSKKKTSNVLLSILKYFAKQKESLLPSQQSNASKML